MNIRRGLVRLWICVSLCWILAAGLIFHDHLVVGQRWIVSQLNGLPIDCAHVARPSEDQRPMQRWTDQELECFITEDTTEVWTAL